MNPQNDADRARHALAYFHNQALSHYPETYSLTLEGLIGQLTERSSSFMVQFGKALRVAALPENQIRSGMESLANAGKGKLPRYIGDWFQFIVDGTMPTAWTAVKVVVQSAGDAVGAVGDVGLKTLANAGSLIQYVPYVLFAGLALVVFFKAKRI